MGWDVTVGSDNADNFAKFCQAHKLKFTIRDGFGKVSCRFGCVFGSDNADHLQPFSLPASSQISLRHSEKLLVRC